MTWVHVGVGAVSFVAGLGLGVWVGREWAAYEVLKALVKGFAGLGKDQKP